MKKIERKIYTIDATDQVLGRLASKISLILTGKNRPDYIPNIVVGGIVLIKNVKKIKITGDKLNQKLYYHHSGYPGGLKTKKMIEIFDKDPAEVMRRAVYNMLPKNKLRKPRFKRLRFI